MRIKHKHYSSSYIRSLFRNAVEKSNLKQAEVLLGGSQKSCEFEGVWQDSMICVFTFTNAGYELQKTRLLLEKTISIT